MVIRPARKKIGRLSSAKTSRQPRALGPHYLERGWSFFFSNEPTAEFGYYGSGFLEAARTLARSFARRRGRSQIDILPVLFLYRHSIELLAKAAIITGNRLLQIRGAGQDEKGLFANFRCSRHRLVPLLDAIRQVFDDLSWEWHWPNSEVKSFDDVKRVMKELDALDPDSFNFRYPTDIRGQRAVSTSHLIGQRTVLAALDDLAESLDTTVYRLNAECG